MHLDVVGLAGRTLLRSNTERSLGGVPNQLALIAPLPSVFWLLLKWARAVVVE